MANGVVPLTATRPAKSIAGRRFGALPAGGPARPSGGPPEVMVQTGIHMNEHHPSGAKSPIISAATDTLKESAMWTIANSRVDHRLLFAFAAVVVSACSCAKNAAGQNSDETATVPATQTEVWLCAGDRIAELLDTDAEWPFVQQHLTGIKLYIGQLATNRRRPAESSTDRIRQIAELVKNHNLKVAVELGGCLDFSPLDDTAGEWSARRELAAMENFYAVGGKVDYLDIDGPIRRLLHPQNRRDGKKFESIEGAADELVDALRIHRAAHPETQYWLLTNFPNWGYRGDVSYHARGPQRQDYGDYDTVVRTVLKKLSEAKIPLEGVTVDNPYDYLIGEHRSVKLPDPTEVDWLGRVRTYEDFVRQNGLSFNLIANSERGGHESDERFYKESLQMVDAYLKAGGKPTRWFVQTWYQYPKQLLPESAPHSIMSLTKAVIQRTRGTGKLSVNGS